MFVILNASVSQSLFHFHFLCLSFSVTLPRIQQFIRLTLETGRSVGLDGNAEEEY